MEEDREVIRLARVLREIAHTSRHIASTDARQGAPEFCAHQYNRVLGRLGELDPAIAQIFPPLPTTAPPSLVRAVAKELAAFVAGDLRHRHRSRRDRRVRAIRVGFGWLPENGK